MAQVKLLFFSDPHNSDTPPLMRRQGYRDEILEKQAFIIPHAKKADVTIIGGDVFHQKKAHKISHYLISRLMEIYSEYGLTYIIPGNHDFDMHPSEIAHNPLGIIGRLPNVKVLHGLWANGIMGMDLFFKGLGDCEQEKSLVELLHAWEKEQADIQKDRSAVPYSIAVIHDAVTKKEYPYPTIPFDDIARFADLFFFGHLHDWQELGGKVVAPGALSRGVLKRDSVDRSVGFAWVEVDTEARQHVIKGYKIPVKPSTEVFKIGEKIAEENIRERVEQFLDYLKEFDISLSTTSVAQIMKKLEKMNLPLEVKDKALEILREIE